MRTIERLQEMLKRELETVFLERLEVTQLIGPFAFHFCVRKRRLR